MLSQITIAKKRTGAIIALLGIVSPLLGYAADPMTLAEQIRTQNAHMAEVFAQNLAASQERARIIQEAAQRMIGREQTATEIRLWNNLRELERLQRAAQVHRQQVIDAARLATAATAGGVGAGVTVTTGAAGGTAVAAGGISAGAAAGLAVAIPLTVAGAACSAYRIGYNSAVANNATLCMALRSCESMTRAGQGRMCSINNINISLSNNADSIRFWGDAYNTCAAALPWFLDRVSLYTACPRGNTFVPPTVPAF